VRARRARAARPPAHARARSRPAGTFDGVVVAVKVLSSDSAERDSDAHRMFFKEAHVLQKCHHK
jgi:hypothetical protein